MASQLDPERLLFQIISNARGVDLDDYYLTDLLKRHFPLYRDLRCANLRSLACLPKRQMSRWTIHALTSSATALRHLICHTPSWEPPIMGGSIPWASLTYISIITVCITTAGWWTLIRSLEALQVGEISANLICPESDIATRYPKKHLPQLRELRLWIDLIFYPLVNLEFPSLTTPHYDGPAMSPEFLRRLFLSSPRITTLHLGRSCLDHDSLTSETWIQWSDAHQLEVLIIDIFFDPIWENEHRRLEWLYLHHPPPNLRRLVLVYITKELSNLERWMLKFYAWCLIRRGIEIEVRQEDYKDYWRLTRKELREWMEIWYVVVRYADFGLVLNHSDG